MVKVMDIDGLPRMVDQIIAEIVEKYPRQEHLENAVKARSHFLAGLDLLKHVGIPTSYEECEFDQETCASIDYRSVSGERADDYDHIKCNQFDKCKEAHDRYMKLIGNWKLVYDDGSAEDRSTQGNQ